MKKTTKYLCFLLAILLAFVLFGCTYYPNPSGVHIYYSTDGSSYNIDFNNGVIEYNDTAYSFEANRDGGKLWITVYYPNGATYYSGGSSNAVWSGDYDPQTYVPGETLVEILEAKYTAVRKGPTGIHVFMLIFCLIFGGVGVFFPRAAWEIEHLFKSWQYESYEPSNAGLFMTRIGGALAMLMGIIFFFSNWK